MLNINQLRYVYQEATQPRLDLYLPLLQETMAKYEIDTPQRIRMFLAQVGHESGQLRYTEEIALGTAYEGRLDLGNNVPGDGMKYKGRGLIQLTGKKNYALAALALDQPLLEHPELLAQPSLACQSAGWYWKNNNLNTLCDMGLFETLTRRINGGLNGYADRYKLFQRALEVI